MRGFLITSFSLASVFGIYYFAGLRGLVVGLLMLLLFEGMHYRVYGKSIAKIKDEDYHDHPDNPKTQLDALRMAVTIRHGDRAGGTRPTDVETAKRLDDTIRRILRLPGSP